LFLHIKELQNVYNHLPLKSDGFIRPAHPASASSPFETPAQHHLLAMVLHQVNWRLESVSEKHILITDVR
jgi:hypothetical protein